MCWQNAYNTRTSPLLLLLTFVFGEKSENKRRCLSKIRVAMRSSSNHFKTWAGYLHAKWDVSLRRAPSTPLRHAHLCLRHWRRQDGFSDEAISFSGQD